MIYLKKTYYLMWMICLPIMLEADTILKLWLGEYPSHSVSFLILILILCLIQTLKTPRTTIFHAMAKVFAANITVGIVLCLAFPLAYLFVRIGGSPESVFWAANITMAASELVSVFVLKKYMDYSIIKYLWSVHGRCVLVSFLSLIIPYLVYDKLLDAGFVRLLVTCVLTTVSVVITSLYVGMDKEMRLKLYGLIKTKIKK